jgi:hypothetical protein
MGTAPPAPEPQEIQLLPLWESQLYRRLLVCFVCAPKMRRWNSGALAPRKDKKKRTTLLPQGSRAATGVARTLKNKAAKKKLAKRFIYSFLAADVQIVLTSLKSIINNDAE